jgi:hypothetical protein
VQEFKLAGPFAPPGVSGSQTASFQIALDASGKSLYVVTQDTAATRDFQQGNTVHALSVAADGTLTESNPAVTFSAADVPAAARLQGVAVVSLRGSDGSDNGDNGPERDDSLPGVSADPQSLFSAAPVHAVGINSDSSLSILIELARGGPR